MQIYTENRFCLPLFYLIVLGVALSIWICPDKAFATGASSGVHDDQPRQAPEGLPPSRMPEAFRLRTEAIRELQRISAQMEKLAGFNPGWGARVRGTKMEALNPQPLNEQSVE